MANTIRLKRGTTTPTAGVLVTGEVAINTTDGLAYTKTDAGDVVQIGGASNTALALIATVRNETGATLTKGTVVYVSGASSNKALVTKAIATGDPTSAGTYGLVQADILHNNNGTVVIGGIISGLNTDGYTNGDKIYLSPTTAGGWTTTKPSAPNHLVYIGTITYVHANQGAIQLRIQNGFEIEELHNVAISATPSNGDVLTYELSTGLWKNQAPSGGGGGISDAPADGYSYVRQMNSWIAVGSSTYETVATQEWVNLQSFLTSASLSGYATESYVTSQGYQTSSDVSTYVTGLGYLTDAPSDGSEYVRKDGAWAVATGGGGGGIAEAPNDGKAYSRKSLGWTESKINDYDNSVTYAVGDQVVYSNVIYTMTTAVGAAGYDPISYPSYWTGISGPTGAAGANGTNGTNGTMNPLDILTITANSYGAYAGGSTWSVTYYLINNGGGGWAGNKYPTVYFNLYVNGVYDSTASGSYTYYYATGSLVAFLNTGDHIEVRLADGVGGEATINYADFYV